MTVETAANQDHDQDRDRLKNARDQAGAQYECIVEMLEDYRLAEAVERRAVEGEEDDHEDAIRRLFQDSGKFELRMTEEDDPRFYWRAVGDDTPFDAGYESAYNTENEAMFACCEASDLIPSSEDARQRMEENALSVQVRSDWHSPGEESEDSEFEILLCTGGPAVRIVGELDRGSPTRAWMECQDWFTPWTEVFGYGEGRGERGERGERFAKAIDGGTLLEYASVFYFGG